jgi:hypothetical protein
VVAAAVKAEPLPHRAAGLRELEAKTDANGRCRLFVVPPARYVVAAALTGHVTKPIEVDLPPREPGARDGKAVGVDPPAFDRGRLRVVLPRGAPLRVMLTGPDPTDWIDLELLDAAGPCGFATRDLEELAAGRVLFEGHVLPGTYRLVIREENGRSQEREVVIPSLEPVEVSIGFDR